MSDSQLFQIDVFIVQNGLFSIQNSTKHFFWAFLVKKERMIKFPKFWPKPGTLFSIKNGTTYFFLAYFAKKERIKNIFTKTKD